MAMLGKTALELSALIKEKKLGVVERSHPFDNVNDFRDDEVRPSFDRALILQNAPFRNDEMIIAPKTVE